MPTVSPTVSFRLTPDLYQLLQQRASGLALSPGELARRIVTETLEASPATDIQAHLMDLKDDIGLFQKAFVAAVEGLLVAAGKTKPEDAKTWVRENVTNKMSP